VHDSTSRGTFSCICHESEFLIPSARGKLVIPRLISAIFCALVIWQLFRLNREGKVQTSKALWIPTFWFFIAATRNVSSWLQLSGGGDITDQYLEGSPLDRTVLTVVLALGVIVLLTRTQRVGMLLRSNLPIVLYFLYCGISASWSDFPDVAFKRWFRASGDVVMVLIVLSDPHCLAAFRRLFARIGFVVIPLSVLFIRYFPEYGRAYSRGGAPSWTGVATDKNALGMLCLIFGLAFIFRFFQLYGDEDGPRKTGPLIAHGSLIAMTLFLLLEANSATAFSCFFLAGVPLVLTYRFRRARKPAFVHVMVLALLGVAFSALFLNFGSSMVEDLGRDSTLTGRTAIWQSAFTLVRNPLIGTGFESFWVGPRVTEMKALIHQPANEAHNGYIEVFLNLGWVGVALLATILVTGYRRIVSAVRRNVQVASLCLAYFVALAVYNFTEAGFHMMGLTWLTLLLTIMVIPEVRVRAFSSSLGEGHVEDLADCKAVAAKGAVQACETPRASWSSRRTSQARPLQVPAQQWWKPR
jgi:exopolysaccharide production protein ExoQ